MSLIGKLRNSLAISLASITIGCGSGSSGGGSGSYNQPGYDQETLDDLLNAFEEAGGSNNQNDNYTPPPTPVEVNSCGFAAECISQGLGRYNCEIRRVTSQAENDWNYDQVDACVRCVDTLTANDVVSTPSEPEPEEPEDPYADYDGYSGCSTPIELIAHNLEVINGENLYSREDGRYATLTPQDPGQEAWLEIRFSDDLPPDVQIRYYPSYDGHSATIQPAWGRKEILFEQRPLHNIVYYFTSSYEPESSTLRTDTVSLIILEGQLKLDSIEIQNEEYANNCL